VISHGVLLDSPAELTGALDLDEHQRLAVLGGYEKHVCQVPLQRDVQSVPASRIVNGRTMAHVADQMNRLERARADGLKRTSAPLPRGKIAPDSRMTKRRLVTRVRGGAAGDGGDQEDAVALF
jgi:hypothetical protein